MQAYAYPACGPPALGIPAGKDQYVMGFPVPSYYGSCLDASAFMFHGGCCPPAFPHTYPRPPPAPPPCPTSAPPSIKPAAELGSAKFQQAKVPAWLSGALLRTSFFVPCENHKTSKKNECTFFCVTCATGPQSLCQHCMAAHQGHEVIQVRRYVYQDVIRSVDISQYVDTTGVQCYIINQAKVVFINPRPNSKMGSRMAPDTCRTCTRHLREGAAYCSLACKVQALAGGDAWEPTTTTAAPAAQAPAAPASNDSVSSSSESEEYTAAGIVRPTATRVGSMPHINSTPAAHGAGVVGFKRGSSTSSSSGSDVAMQHSTPCAAAAAAAEGTVYSASSSWGSKRRPAQRCAAGAAIDSSSPPVLALLQVVSSCTDSSSDEAEVATEDMIIMEQSLNNTNTKRRRVALNPDASSVSLVVRKPSMAGSSEDDDDVMLLLPPAPSGCAAEPAPSAALCAAVSVARNMCCSRRKQSSPRPSPMA